MEPGETILTIALLLTVYALAAHIIGIWKKKIELFDSARIAIIGIAVLTTIASIWLFNLFITRNFQYEYVAIYSSLDLPMAYTISAFWAGADGSLLLWAWLISIYIAVIAARGRSYDKLIKHAMPVILVTLAYFFYMLLTVSRPFKMLDFMPEDGNGLNPLLQDPGMFFHPSTLFWGYAGVIIPFALMVAGIYLSDDTWTYRARRWNNRRTLGGYMCHIAILMIIVAAAGAVVYEQAQTFNMRIGGTYSTGDYDFELTSIDQYAKNNKEVQAAYFDVYKNGGKVLSGAEARMYHYAKQESTNVKPMAYTVGIDDLYFSAQAITADSATVKIKVMPMMFLMWIGGFYVLIPGILVCISTVVPIRQKRASDDINQRIKTIAAEGVYET